MLWLTLNLWYSCISFPGMTTHATWLYAYVYDTHVCRILHIQTCVHMLVHMCKGQKKTPYILRCHPQPCFLKMGYHIEPQAGWVSASPSKPPVSYLNNWRGFKAYKCPCLAFSMCARIRTQSLIFHLFYSTKKKKTKTSMMIYDYNPSTWEVETGEWSSRSASVT